MLEPPTPPLPVRLFNATGRLASRLGARPLAFTPRALEARARRATGLHDFGDGAHEEALDVLCRSLEEDAALSLTGRVVMRRAVERALGDRLRRIEAVKRRPEIFERPLNRPVVVLGLPRSGTTFLHRLLSLAPGTRALRTFEVQRPFAPSGTDDRRAQSESDLRRIKSIARDLDRKHYMAPDEPEECMWLLNSSLVSATFWVLAPVYGYLDWYLAQDQRDPYRAYREHLQLFQAESPDARLTLKAPIHTGHLDALLDAVPEALVVQTHRDPKPVVGSANSLFFTLHAVTSERMDAARMGRTNLAMLSRLMQRHLEARARWPERVLDVRYDDLIAAPVETLRRVHEHFELGWDAAIEARVAEHLAQRTQHRFGRHTYDLEDCGLDEAMVDDAFAGYRARFLAA